MATYTEFLEGAFPIINLSCLLVATFLVLVKSYFNRVDAPLTISRLLVGVLSLGLVGSGSVMTFGPEVTARLSAHVVLLGAIGLYMAITAKNMPKIIFFIYSVIVLLCLVGAGYVFTGGNIPTSKISELLCYAFYGGATDKCDSSWLKSIMTASTVATAIITTIVAASIPGLIVGAQSNQSSYYSMA